MEHARMIAAQRQAKDDEIVRLRERCRILELSKAEYDDLLDSKDNELAAQDDEIERLQRENEEVMRQKAYQYQRAKKAEEELAALKSQSAEPVAWMFQYDEAIGYVAFSLSAPTKEETEYLKESNRPAWVPLYTTPTAVLENSCAEAIAALPLEEK